MPIAVRHLEAAAFDDGGAITLAQGAPLGPSEGQPQKRGIRAGSRHGRAGEEAGQRRVVDLTVVLAVIVLLHPGLRRLIEPGEGEIIHTLEHGHQPALDRSPQNLLLAVNVWRIWQRRLMKDAEPGETFGDLGRRHSTHMSSIAARRLPRFCIACDKPSAMFFANSDRYTCR